MRNTVCERILGDVINDRVEEWIGEQARVSGGKAFAMAYEMPLIDPTGEHTANFQAEAFHHGEVLTVTGFVTGSDVVCVKATDENGTTVYPVPRKALIRR